MDFMTIILNFEFWLILFLSPNTLKRKVQFRTYFPEILSTILQSLCDETIYFYSKYKPIKVIFTSQKIMEKAQVSSRKEFQYLVKILEK